MGLSFDQKLIRTEQLENVFDSLKHVRKAFRSISAAAGSSLDLLLKHLLHQHGFLNPLDRAFGRERRI